MKPFLKWVGGKTQLLPEIHKVLPKKFKNYYEMFVGGGSVLFSLGDTFKTTNYIINDINKDLINTYNVVRDSVDDLILELNKHINQKEYYYDTRNLDRNDYTWNNLTNIQKAARFIYLNKTCFNGLYRVNSKNQFNVPFGNYKNPCICNETVLRNCSYFLNTYKVKTNTFPLSDLSIPALKDSFIYMDPPYVPISKTSNFTNYSSGGFTEDDQLYLLKYCDLCTKNNIKFLLSNSHCDKTLDLYKDYEIIKIDAKRNINSKGDGRGKVKEILVRNYS